MHGNAGALELRGYQRYEGLRGVSASGLGSAESPAGTDQLHLSGHVYAGLEIA